MSGRGYREDEGRREGGRRNMSVCMKRNCRRIVKGKGGIHKMRREWVGDG